MKYSHSLTKGGVDAEIRRRNRLIVSLCQHSVGNRKLAMAIISGRKTKDMTITCPNILTRAFAWNPVNALKLASQELSKDPKLVSRALGLNGLALEATDYFQNDKTRVEIAIVENGLALRFASKRLRNDTDIVTRAVTQNWRALKYASRSLRNNKEILNSTIKKSGSSLQHASRSLRNNYDLVSLAVRKTGSALKFASKRLKNQRDLCRLAMKSTPNNYKYIGEQMQNKSEFYVPFFNSQTSNDILKEKSNLEFLSLDLKKLKKGRKRFILYLMDNREEDIFLRAKFRKALEYENS